MKFERYSKIRQTYKSPDYQIMEYGLSALDYLSKCYDIRDTWRAL